MMEQSTPTERPKKKADQRERLYSLQKKLKKEQGNAQYYIILQILKKNGNESEWNIMQKKTSFKLILPFLTLFFVNFHLNN